MERRKQSFMSRMRLLYCISICFFLFFTLISTVSTRTPSIELQSSSGRNADCCLQELENVSEDRESSAQEETSNLKRRYLSGPGSSPPRCTSKCGKCTPCKPIHVPVPPGTPVTTEYYPEAWRCKCGNKLYMP